MTEKVYSIWDYHDGPRSGIANYDGSPHFFSCIFDEGVDEYSTVFEITQISDELYNQCAEISAIFDTWKLKFEAGDATTATHPSRTDDHCIKLDKLIGTQLSLSSPRTTASAEFKTLGGERVTSKSLTYDIEVTWRKL